MIAITKIIDLLDKPALVSWANKLGLQGVDLKSYYKDVTNEGTKKHNQIEEFFLYGIEFDGCDVLINNLKEYEIISVEETIRNDLFIGRIDLVLKKDNKIYVCDFKRNNKIYLKTKLQLSAYKEIINADSICFINSNNFKIEEIHINTKKYYDIVKKLHDIYILLLELNEKL